VSEITTLASVKEHLNITGTAHDSKLLALMRQCEALLWGWLEIDGFDDFYYQFGEGGTDTLELAMLLMVQKLYDQPGSEPLDRAVKMVLSHGGLRGPTAV
jgi:hypothetical protein